MNPIRSLGAALALGLLGDLLFRDAALGINLLIWVTVLGMDWLVLSQERKAPFTRSEVWLWAAMLFFAAAVAGRASPALGFFNFTAMAGAAALLPFGQPEASPVISRLRVRDAIRAALGAGGSLVAGLLPAILHERGPRAIAGAGRGRDALAAGRGVLLAAPLLLVFASLFSSADEGFRRLAARLFDFDLSSLVSHLFFVGLFAWVAGGFFTTAGRRDGGTVGQLEMTHPSHGPTAPRPFVGAIEVGVILGLLNLLFLSFVILQLGYFFGGAEAVRAVAGLTYAEYARRGFFELVSVAALVLPVLLGGQAVLGPGDRRAERVFRWSARALVGLVFVVMASAVHRMVLYQREFGLTELRFYASGFMGWLGGAFIWLLATALRGRPERFLPGALLAWAIGVAGLDAVNPDRVIIETNLARAEAGRSMDVSYASGLSADAVPALVTALPGLSQVARAKVAPLLLACWSPPSTTDWREWNLGRRQAWIAVGEAEGSLRAMVQGAVAAECTNPSKEPRMNADKHGYSH